MSPLAAGRLEAGPGPVAALRVGERRPRQPSAWLNWLQIPVGIQSSGTPRIIPRAAPDLRPAIGDEPLEPTFVLIKHSGADAALRAGLPAPKIEQAKRVGDIAGDGGDPAERRSQHERGHLASRSTDDPAIAGRQDVAPIFAGRPPVERRSSVEIHSGDELTNGGICHRSSPFGSTSGRDEGVIVGEDLEAEPLIDGAASLGCHEHERPTS